MTLPETFVADAIDAHVEKNESVHAWDGKWHPSSISGCLRKAIYSMRQTPVTDPKTPKQNRILFIGTHFHEIVQTALAEADPTIVEFYSEVRILIPDLNLTGDADGLLLATHANGTAELIEIKTIKEYGFKILTEPKSDHVEQTKSYVTALRLHGGVAQDGRVIPPLGDRLTHVRFIYIEKQSFDTKELMLEVTPAWETDLRTKIAEAEAYRANPDSLPPRLPMNGNKKDYRCDWGWGKCDFFTRCWEQDPPEIALTFRRS